jgi:hypothetical protein
MVTFPMMYGVYVIANPDLQYDTDGNRIDCYVYEGFDYCLT